MTSMVDISTTTRRPVEDVFAVLSGYSNGSNWTSGAIEPKPTADNLRDPM
jgi:hypothetical protein